MGGDGPIIFELRAVPEGSATEVYVGTLVGFFRLVNASLIDVQYSNMYARRGT